MGFRVITVPQLWDMLEEPDVFVIDLRARCDFCRSHLKGARNLPFDEMKRWERTLPGNRRIILCCEYGNTSLYAAKHLASRGFRVYTLIGGLNALNG